MHRTNVAPVLHINRSYSTEKAPATVYIREDMSSVYHHWLVALSIAVATLVSYTALRLAARVAASEGQATRIWLGIGAITMGGGIWSMHFIGMLALSLPINLTYGVSLTLTSLVVAILTSGFSWQSPAAAGSPLGGSQLQQLRWVPVSQQCTTSNGRDHDCAFDLI